MNAIVNNCNLNSNCQDKVNFSNKLTIIFSNLKKYLYKCFLYIILLIEKHCSDVVISHIPFVRKYCLYGPHNMQNRKCRICQVDDIQPGDPTTVCMNCYTDAEQFPVLEMYHHVEEYKKNCPEYYKKEEDLKNIKCRFCQADDIKRGDSTKICEDCYRYLLPELSLLSYCEKCEDCKQIFEYMAYEHIEFNLPGYPVCSNCQVKYLKKDYITKWLKDAKKRSKCEICQADNIQPGDSTKICEDCYFN